MDPSVGRAAACAWQSYAEWGTHHPVHRPSPRAPRLCRAMLSRSCLRRRCSVSPASVGP